jgi:hypothetical protein
MVNDPPLQIILVKDEIAGAGLILTVTVNEEPGQPLLTGVTVYVAVVIELDVLTRVPLMFSAVDPDAPPVKPVPEGASQLYVVPAGTVPLVASTGVTVNAIPLLTVIVIGRMAGFGLTVTFNSKSGPGHPPTEGVTV